MRGDGRSERELVQDEVREMRQASMEIGMPAALWLGDSLSELRLTVGASVGEHAADAAADELVVAPSHGERNWCRALQVKVEGCALGFSPRKAGQMVRVLIESFEIASENPGALALTDKE